MFFHNISLYLPGSGVVASNIPMLQVNIAWSQTKAWQSPIGILVHPREQAERLLTRVILFVMTLPLFPTFVGRH
jgi:hypothetical protein